MDLARLADYMATPIVLPASYKKKDVLIYAVGIGCTEDRFLYELHPDFEVFPLFPSSLFRKGNSDDVHFQKHNPFTLASSDLPYERLNLTRCLNVLDAERYIECVRPVPLEGMPRLDFRFQTTYVTRKREGEALLSEFTATMEHPETKEVYYRCWCTAFAIMTHPVAAFADCGRSEAVPGTRTGPIQMPNNRSPDALERYRIHPLQAVHYRLTGEFGPPATSLYGGQNGGAAPAMPGLCTLAVISRVVLRRFGRNEARSFHAVKVRFSAFVLSGQTLEIKMWLPADGEETRNSGGPPPVGTRRVLFHVTVVETGATAVQSAFMDLNEEFFQEQPQGEAAAAAGGTGAKL